MDRRYHRVKDGPDTRRFPALFFLSVCFGIGLILGCVFASYLEADANAQLLTYLDQYLSLVQENHAELPSLFSVFWEVFRWPLMAGILGLTLLGVVAVPLTFLIRGFLLSYTISVFVQLYGKSGLSFAAAIFGISAILSVTALFSVGIKAFECGRALNGTGTRSEQKNRVQEQKSLLMYTVVTLCWVSFGAGIQYWLSPILLRNVSEFLM